ncbi:MAG: threonine aldolase family protein [Eubacteriaceae bacterium]
MKLFLSDNASGVHPLIMEALLEANNEHAPAYGEDHLTFKAKEAIGETFGCSPSQVHFVINGTGANVLANASFLRSYESLVCVDTAHINGPETGAFENFSGSRIVTVPHLNGKLKVQDLESIFGHEGDIHYSQPKMISISQLTEMGSLYTPDEIKEIAEYAHNKGAFLHVDGARIANAVVALDVNFKELITDTGVDVLSFGGTKNGLMFGECIVCFNKEMNQHLPYMVKHGNQLLSKMRFISAQFLAYVKNEIWKENALKANAMAVLLKNELEKLGFIEYCVPVEGNIVMVSLPEKVGTYLVEKEMVHDVEYNNKKYFRFVTSFDTKTDEIQRLAEMIKERLLK